MKQIGRGWQYTAYDIGNGRVYKKYNNVFTAYWVILCDCFPYQRHKLHKLPSYYKGCKETARESIKKISNTGVERWMLGNPKVLNEFDYEQDKVIPIHQYFEMVDVTKGKEIIDRFIEFNKILVAHSLIDKSFNMTKNFGVDEQNRIVLIDLGELYSSETEIKKQIKKQMWRLPYVAKVIPDPLRPYFLKRMDGEFNNE